MLSCSRLRAHNSMVHAAPRAISALAIFEGRGTKSNLVTTKSHWLLCFCAPGRTAVKRGNILGQRGITQMYTSSGRSAKAGYSLPLLRQEAVWNLQAVCGKAGSWYYIQKITLAGENTPINSPVCRRDVLSRMWEQPMLANSNHQAENSRWSAVHPRLPTCPG